MPLSIEVADAVEIVSYPSERAYHGTYEALVAAGIDRRRLPAGKIGSRNSGMSWHKFASWSSRPKLDGTIVYWCEHETGLRRRLKQQAEAEAERERERAERWQQRDAKPLTMPAKPARPSYLQLIVDNKE
jgi:hypothetical protein